MFVCYFLFFKIIDNKLLYTIGLTYSSKISHKV